MLGMAGKTSWSVFKDRLLTMFILLLMALRAIDGSGALRGFVAFIGHMDMTIQTGDLLAVVNGSLKGLKRHMELAFRAAFLVALDALFNRIGPRVVSYKEYEYPQHQKAATKTFHHSYHG